MVKAKKAKGISTSEKKLAASKKRVTARKKTSVILKKQDQPRAEEQQVEASKYSVSPIIQKFHDAAFKIPSGYGDNRITLMVRDPHWIYSYWEINTKKIEEAKKQLGNSKKILRVYDVTDVNFNGANARSYFDIYISDESTNWYINIQAPSRSYCVDIGMLSPDGRFITLARSNVVTTPRDRMSDIIDEEWMSIDFDKIYALSGGFGMGKGSEEIRELISKRLQEHMGSGWSGSFSGAQKQRRFWLVADAELIIYGATEPSASVTIAGMPIELRADGTFSQRFAFPDGKKEIEIKAISKDKIETKKITPIVERHTRAENM